MTKKTYLISGICFFFGLLAGAVAVSIHFHKIEENEAFARGKEIACSSVLATDAYQHESSSNAINTLLDHLVDLQWEKQQGENPSINISEEIAMTEGQLAQLYRQAGQMDYSEMYTTDALEDAKVSNIFFVTNQATLSAWVNKDCPRTEKY